MNINEFIDAVFLRFPPKTSPYKQIEDYYGEYRNALQMPEGYDYQDAYDDFIKNYRYFAVPFPSTLLNFVKKHPSAQETICPALAHIRSIMREPKPDFAGMSEVAKQRIRDIYKKLGYKSRLKEFKYD